MSVRYFIVKDKGHFWNLRYWVYADVEGNPIQNPIPLMVFWTHRGASRYLEHKERIYKARMRIEEA
jgi:hypothetical protein